MQVKKGDKVKVIAGADKGKIGVIERVLVSENKVVVEGVNIMKRHMRPRKQGEKGGIIDRAMPLNASNVALLEKGAKKEVKEKPKAKKVTAKKKAE